MSVATLEAMAAGLPLIVTRTPGTAELVEEGVNGWTFAWGDVETLTVLLRQLAMNRSLARGLGAASRARAQLFSWNRPVERYLEIFRQMEIGVKPGPRLENHGAELSA
jgi:glycosyltransferase involved in cell wall biosynthesis